MARSTLRRRTPSVEHLESRVVLSASGPNHELTLMIDTMSRMRMHPSQAAEWVEENADALVQTNVKHYGVNLDEVKAAIAKSPARQPLAYNAKLTSAAQGHSDDMARNNFQSHTSSDGRNLSQRLDQAGYDGRLRYSENAFAYAESMDKTDEGYIDNALEAFLIDWGVQDAGHRKNILEPDDHDDARRSDEVGIGLSLVDDPIRDRAVVVQNFGSRDGASGQLTGVVFEDENGDGEFSYREGRSAAEIRVTNTESNETKTVRPWDAGMYQVPLEPGDYEVAIKVEGTVVEEKSLRMGTANQKLDVNLTELRPRVASAREAARSAEASTKAIKSEATRSAQASTQAPKSEATRSVQVQAQRVETPETKQAETTSQARDAAATSSRPTTRIDRGEARETQMLADLITSGLLPNPNSLTISSAASWRAK